MSRDVNERGPRVFAAQALTQRLGVVAGLVADEAIGTTCCFATQDKVWVTGPAGEKWEVYTVLSDSDTFGSSRQRLDKDNAEGGVCCGGTKRADHETQSAIAATCS